MAPPRQTMLRPVGLVTQPNKFGWYVDGALSRAINCVMRNPGELDAAPGMFGAANCGVANATIYKAIALNAGHVYTFASGATNVWDIRENNNSLSISGFASLTGLLSQTGRISPVRARDRMLVNTANGYLVGDNMAPSNAGERALRLAGLPQLTMRSMASTTATSPSGTIPANNPNLVFGYVAIHTRTYADGYYLASVPTPIVKRFGHPTLDTSVTVNVGWVATDVMVVGDVIELYRSDGLATSDVNTDPPNVFKLVNAHTITAADIAAANYTFVDSSRMNGAPYFQTTGRELYSNPGQGGSTVINRQPPVAQSTAVFDGRVFYANTTDRAKLAYKVPAGIAVTLGGTTANTPWWRANGIGTRHLTAGTGTLGSPTWTGIPAADLVGIVPGQVPALNWGPILFSTPNVRVVSVNAGAGTITWSSNQLSASGALPVGVAISDVIYIALNGGTLQPYRIQEMGDLLNSFAGGSPINPPANLFEITSTAAAEMLTGSFHTGVFNQNVAYTIEPRNFGSASLSMQVMATNGANYSPPIVEYTTTPGTLNVNVTQCNRTTNKNRITWCKDQQPEHVNPGNNETFCGLREVIAQASTRDALWIACLDGIFRLTGTGGQYRLDQIDSTAIICAPQAMCVLGELVYIYTNFGVLELNSETRNNLTDKVIGDLLPGPQYAEIPTIQMVGNETDLEVLLLDVASKNRIYVYATAEGAGWTTLENNPGTSLSNVTMLAFQRSPASGDARVLVGTSPLGGNFPQLDAWGDTSGFLPMDVLFQPVYADDPMVTRQWIEASYLFDVASAGKTLRPSWNATPSGLAPVVLYQNKATARAGCPRAFAVAESIAVGFDSLAGGSVQARLLGISLLYNPLTTQAKQRT
jgi:hypothetical protein